MDGFLFRRIYVGEKFQLTNRHNIYTFCFFAFGGVMHLPAAEQSARAVLFLLGHFTFLGSRHLERRHVFLLYLFAFNSDYLSDL